MSEITDRPRVLRAIKKCLTDAFDFYQDAMDILDSIGEGSMGAGMTPLVGGFAMKDPKDSYREALIKVDAAENALLPLIKRFKDGRVNELHFSDEKALVMLKDLESFDHQLLIDKLSQQRGRESVWYRLRELSEKVKHIYKLTAES
ncbi:MAG: hypothetical protein BAJATHORv1_10113 [Candidatus Thorarchaeota archaeon]|nr:MAG: hypothetical protein BAJATHORv1_10113 [Candidatus Thorarchaeota archaeon]